MHEKTPFEELLHITYRWYDPKITEETLQRVRELMRQVDPEKKEREQGNYGLKRLMGTKAIPDELLQELVNLLIGKGAKLQVCDARGNLLHICVIENEQRFFQQFLDLGVDVNGLSRLSQQTPLHVAVELGRLYFVKTLLEREDVKVNEQDENKQTPLHLAVAANQVECVKLLLAHPAVKLNLKDKQGKTAQQLIENTQTDPEISRAFQQARRNDRSSRWQANPVAQTTTQPGYDYLGNFRNCKAGYHLVSQASPDPEQKDSQPRPGEPTSGFNWLNPKSWF